MATDQTCTATPEPEAPLAESDPSEPDPARPRPLPPGTVFVDLLGVNYAHFKTSDGGDVYLTHYGQGCWEHLLPENWYAREWFVANRERLIGTSTVYRLPTRPVHGRKLHLVVKWSRVGEEVPVDTKTINKFINAEFNSPFEEFSLLMELRAGSRSSPGLRIRTQKPLAIYVPPERLLFWQTGRTESRIAAKLARHPGVELDILRQYVLLYGWIDGLDITEVADLWEFGEHSRAPFLSRATTLVMHELEVMGYQVADMKPAHIIVRLRPDNSMLKDRNGQMAYALVDYELMERTPAHEKSVRQEHRRTYLQHMARRFETPCQKPLPPHLKPTRVLGVDYVFGHAESTGGLLWVVGKDPDLFNYFLPERWRRTPKLALSASNQVFRTCTKDNVHLVWRISRMGDKAQPQDPPQRARAIADHGFNSPFEEFAHALALTRAGLRTIYPRAIYMTGHKADAGGADADHRRFRALTGLNTPEGEPAVSPEHDYITIWGFWNGPDEVLAVLDGLYYRGINVEQACAEKRITPETRDGLLDEARRRLRECGCDDLNLVPDHLLLSVAPDDTLVREASGTPEFRLCNFELMRPVAGH